MKQKKKGSSRADRCSRSTWRSDKQEGRMEKTKIIEIEKKSIVQFINRTKSFFFFLRFLRAEKSRIKILLLLQPKDEHRSS